MVIASEQARKATNHRPPRPGDSYRQRAKELAAWAWDRYVIRDDVWGGYIPPDQRTRKLRRPDGTEYLLGSTCTRPAKSKRGVVRFTPAVLECHFRGLRPEHVAGVHTTSLENLSRFGTVELDVHLAKGDDPTSVTNDPKATLAAAESWYKILSARGWHPLLWDSNGAGGYHLDLLLAEPVATPRLFWYLRELVADFSRYGLSARPETFPKQPRLNPKPDGRGLYGNWARLIGRHHTRDHWATVYDGSDWLTGAAAVELVLGIRGDRPDLIPGDMEIRGRVNAYRRKLENRGEGQGRDDIAYNFLAFLRRDLNLSDDESLRYAAEWDAGNRPPKGVDRLREILGNVHNYGQRPYGAGVNPQPDTPAAPNPPTPPPPPAADGLAIILADFRERLKPKFRRGQAVFSETLGREVKPSEGCFAPDRMLVNKLAHATDAPKDTNGAVDPKRLPKFYRDWARSAWAELLNGLEEEADTSEVVGSAEEEFRRAVASGLHEQVTLGREDADPERRSFIDWADRFAKPGRWSQVRSYLIWCRRDGETAPASIAVRVELFGRVRLAGLAEMSHRRFAALAALYGVGRADECRAGGQRCVELTREFLAEVRRGPGGEVDGVTMTEVAGARVRETSVNSSTP